MQVDLKAVAEKYRAQRNAALDEAAAFAAAVDALQAEVTRLKKLVPEPKPE